MSNRRLLRMFLPLVVVGAALTLTAAPAQAAHRIFCGNWGYVEETGEMGWTYDEVQGAGIFDVYAFKVGCHTARRVARSGKTKSYGFTCRYTKKEYEYFKKRCTRGPRVISFASGA